MKVDSRTESTVAPWEGWRRFLPQGVTVFASGLSGFLLLLIGLPVSMVVLMSLRTGFPGETVPFTLENFSAVYLEPRTYEVLLNTLYFAAPVRSSTSSAIWKARPRSLPNSAMARTESASAPAYTAPRRQATSVSEAVLPSMMPR